MKKLVRFLILATLILAHPTLAQPINKATWATPSWEGFIDERKTGLYYDVVTAAYKEAGVEITIKFHPWARALSEVANGRADFTGADSPTKKFIQPKYPILRSTEVAFFKKSTIPSYRSINSLDGKSGVWVLGYTDNLPPQVKQHLHGNGNLSREAALQMVLLGRADYFLDNDYQLALTTKTLEGKFSPDEYETATVYVEDLFMCFTKSPRGQQLANLFDQGMKKLAETGELKRIYAKWNRFSPAELSLSSQRPK